MTTAMTRAAMAIVRVSTGASGGIEDRRLNGIYPLPAVSLLIASGLVSLLAPSF